MTPQHHLPADIERTSLSIITAELAELGLTPPPETAAVVKRVIHTTADFDYARNLRFTLGAVAAGVKALRAGTPIITDTNMALAGITKPGLARLGGTALCYMADPEVAALAKAGGTTRAVASMQRAAQEHPGAVLAVGNAPTALLTIADQIEAGLRPALSLAYRWGSGMWWRARSGCLPPAMPLAYPPSWPWAARAAATWPLPSAMPCSTLPPKCWTPRPGAGGDLFLTGIRKKDRTAAMQFCPFSWIRSGAHRVNLG